MHDLVLHTAIHHTKCNKHTAIHSDLQQIRVHGIPSTLVCLEGP